VALEKKLAQGPVIAVPTITMEGDANGAPHPEPATYRSKFSGKYEHRRAMNPCNESGRASRAPPAYLGEARAREPGC
jgi:hypothetical protein